MILLTNTTLIEDIKATKKMGFMTNFIYAGRKIIDQNTKKEYPSSACLVAAFYRHKGRNDSSYSSPLFLTQCTDKTKGYLSSAYGKAADQSLIKFVMPLNKVK